MMTIISDQLKDRIGITETPVDIWPDDHDLIGIEARVSEKSLTNPNCAVLIECLKSTDGVTWRSHLSVGWRGHPKNAESPEINRLLASFLGKPPERGALFRTRLIVGAYALGPNDEPLMLENPEPIECTFDVGARSKLEMGLSDARV